MSETTNAALKELLEKWRATHEPGEPIGSKGAFTYDVELRLADELEAAWPCMAALERFDETRRAIGDMCECDADGTGMAGLSERLAGRFAALEAAAKTGADHE